MSPTAGQRFDRIVGALYDTCRPYPHPCCSQEHRFVFTEWLRKLTRGITVPIASFLGRIGISANTVTLVGCLLTIAVAVLLSRGHLRLGGICLVVAAALDSLDGTIARQIGKPTRFGAFLDSVLDRVSDSAVLLGLGWWYMSQPGLSEEILAYVATFGSLMVSYTRARAEAIGVECNVGLFTRVERTTVLIAALILGLTPLGLWLLAIGTVLTALHRVMYVYLRTRDIWL